MIERKYHHGNLKEEFLKIAFQFIESNDIDKLTLKILSDITATSRSAIYSHFGSKEALIEAMILDGFRRFDDYLAPILRDQNIDLMERLYQSSKKYIEFARLNSVLYRLLFGNKYSHIRMEVMTKNDPNRSGFGSLMFAIEEGQKQGIFKDGSSYQKTIVVWATLHGLTSLVIDGFVGIDEIYEELFEEIFQNIKFGLVC